MSSQLNEEEIRPKALFSKFLELAEKDTQTCLDDYPSEKGLCPACIRSAYIHLESLASAMKSALIASLSM